VFWQVSLPFQTGLNGYYVLMAVYGFWQWRQGDNHFKAVTSLSMREHAIGIILVLGVTIALALLWQEIAFTRFVYVDVFVTVASVVTTLLVVHKKLENWLYWMVINLVAAWLYWQVELFLTSALFMLYCGLAMYGFWQWKKDYQLHHQDNQRSV
jgi:nicotinamide mononucleotide transporter